jgi:MFS family permease
MPALKLNFTQLGMIFTIGALCTAIGGWIIGPISEYYGRKLGSVWVNLINTVISGITGLVQSFGQMLGIRALVALGFGGMYSPGLAAISEESPPEKRGFYMGLTQSFWPFIGMGIGPIVVGYLLESVGWRFAFFLIMIPGVIIILYMASFMKEPASVAKNIQTRKETGKRVLLHEGKEMHLLDVFKYRNIIVSSIIAIFTMAYLWVLFGFAPSLFGQVHKFSPVLTGWVMCGGGFLCCAMQILGPHLSDRMGRKPLLVMMFGIGTVGGILFAMSPPGTAAGLLAFYFALFCIGLSSYPLYLVIIPTESVPFTLAATAVVVPQGLGEIIGATVFPTLGGRIADTYGLTYTVWIVVICSLISFIACFFLKESAPRILAKKGLKPVNA